MAPPVYRKTAAGVAEVRERRAGLDARARTLLILCDGQRDAATLAQQLRHPVAGMLSALCEMGLLEAVPGASPAAPPPAPVPAPAPPSAPATPPVDEHLALLQRAWRVLEPLFGAGTDERLAPLVAATTPAARKQALDDLRETLAVYRGRKSAAELVRRIDLS